LELGDRPEAGLVGEDLAERADQDLAAQPLTGEAEMLLGLRAYPKRD
jgi:hypothetical protein